MIICVCKNISDKEIKSSVNSGAKSLCELKRSLGVATQCGACSCEVEDLISETKLTTSCHSISQTALDSEHPLATA